MTNSIQEFSTDLLRVYYDRLFPYEAMFNWFSYENVPDNQGLYPTGTDSSFFLRREWSFTIEDDIYIRYQCFRDLEEFKKGIQKRQPHKIDIGAVFTNPPKDHTTLKPEVFRTVERELVFDIDMTDYDDIRTCCDGANICMKCWPFMTMALKLIDRSIREDFGFKNILWIYSGRRGIHCWVCDPEARALSNEARDAVVTYLSVKTGSNENSEKKLSKVFQAPLHPMIKRAYELLEPYFEQYIVDDKGQAILVTKKKYIPILNSMPNDEIKSELHKRWEKNPSLSGAERWQQLKEAIDGKDPSNKKRARSNFAELDAWKVELVLTYCYPRLDANVSKQQNHLLKSPFCVHPKTGRVCIPIDPDDADNFNPFTVPTVRTLCEQIDNYDGEQDPSMKDFIYQTDMKKAIQVFDKTFASGMKRTNQAIIRDKADEVSAMQVDF